MNTEATPGDLGSTEELGVRPKRKKTWRGPGVALTNTRIFNHFHRTYPNIRGAKQMFAAGVRWAEEQHGIVRPADDA